MTRKRSILALVDAKTILAEKITILNTTTRINLSYIQINSIIIDFKNTPFQKLFLIHNFISCYA